MFEMSTLVHEKRKLNLNLNLISILKSKIFFFSMDKGGHFEPDNCNIWPRHDKQANVSYRF